MTIAASLTNDLERAIRMYRVPLLTAIALSLRNTTVDRFLLTDKREEDRARNIIPLRKLSVIEQLSTKSGIGVDSRQFVPFTGSLIFTGLPDANGVIQPVGSLSNVGGRADYNDVVFSSTGDVDAKSGKIRRVGVHRPGNVSWRVRTPVMMAEETSVIDYLAFRCTQLKFLHSIAIKWSDRRWDSRNVGLDQDLYRVEGEKAQMIMLAPMWMSEDMSVLNPALWGSYEDMVRANYEEYLGRTMDEQAADCLAFSQTYEDYVTVLRPGMECETASDFNAAQIGRVQRLLDTQLNKTLHIAFDRNVLNDGKGNDTYRVKCADPSTGKDVTQDVFNQLDADGQWRLTSSFEAGDLALDGWCGTATATYSTDVATDLPPFAYDRDGDPVIGTKSIEIADGFLAKRLVLPDGLFSLRFRAKTLISDARIEVIRNTRLRAKSIEVNPVTDRVTSVKHWRESYETVATSVIRNDGNDWRELFVSFDLKDQFLVAGESYPAHEIYIVISTVSNVPLVPPQPAPGPTPPTPLARFDQFELFLDTEGHEVDILNTVNRSSLPLEVRPELRVVDLERAMAPDTLFGTREIAAAKWKFDGANTVAEVKHRDSYNVRATGTTINGWFKVNSDDEAANQVLANRGGFTLFQKTGTYQPGYACAVDQEKTLGMSVANSEIFSSKSFRNTLLHPAVGSFFAPPRVDWGAADIYKTYHDAYHATGQQPIEWGGGIAALDVKSDIGGGKYLLVTAADPYVTSGTYLTDANYPLITVADYLTWHAGNAYAQIMPVDTVAPEGTSTGFVCGPIPINSQLYQIAPSIGNYVPSPGGYSPRYWYSPEYSPAFSPAVYPPGFSPSPGFAYSPLDPPPSPAPSPLEQIFWPLAKCDWGSPFEWPSDYRYGAKPQWVQLTWDGTFDIVDLLRRYPIFTGGALAFDRWINLDVAMALGDVEVGINGFTVANSSIGQGQFDQAERNGDHLLIATDNPDTIRTAAPISVYGFKIFQRRNSYDDRFSIFTGEAMNFNELQWNIYKDNLDSDGDGVLDFWQDDVSDFGLWTVWPAETTPRDPNRPWPQEPKDTLGKVQYSAEDPIVIEADRDRNRTMIDDSFDQAYLQELIDVQVSGFNDGMMLWDFLTPEQAKVWDYNDRVYDPTCKRYVDRTLVYGDWLRGVILGEWNSINAITDPIPTRQITSPPTVSPAPSPGTSPAPADAQLLLTGVKGWFGFNDLLGYRDSLAQLQAEGLIFNYLQIELRFSAPREELEALLKPYAHSIEQIFDDDYRGNRLSTLNPR